MSEGWRRALGGAVLAGLALGLLDAGVALARNGARLPHLADRARFVLVMTGLVALAVVVATVLACALVALALRTPRRLRAFGAGLVGAMGGAVLALAALSGSGVRRSGVRPYGTVALVILGAAGATYLWRRRASLVGFAGRHARFGAPALALLAGGAYLVHATVYVRHYALAHGLLAALATAALVGLLAARAPRGGHVLASALLAVLVAGSLAGLGVLRAHALRALARQGSAIGQYPVMLLGMLTRGRARRSRARDERLVRGPHLPLLGRDLVLVTIDALRADRLRYAGGVGRTPVLDAMAARGVAFRRAYCTTPHTSYSLASLMTGKYLRSVLALPGPQRRHGTLAQWLAAAGYVTASFSPPAVFAVDGERFADLRERAFDFALRRSGYASAEARVREVEAFLDARAPEERVFVWVHFFEPHEPYESHPAHPFGASARDRYDAEVAAADDAVGALRAAFARRGRRPAWFVTADHGEEFGEHGGTFHGTTVYDEQVRVPLVIEVEGVPPRVLDAPASLVDIVPTVLAGVGIPRPARLRGNDLGPLAFGAAVSTRAFASTGTLRMVTEGARKLVLDLSDGTTELYAWEGDPWERANLADDDPAAVATLRRAIEAWEASHAHYEAERDVGEASPHGEGGEAELPDALNRAIQGDVSVAVEVAGMLAAGGAPVRQRAARVLGELGARDPRIRDALAGALRSGDARLAFEAGLSLALLGDPRGRPTAVAAMADPRIAVQRRAAMGLAQLRDHAAVPVLAAWVTAPGVSDAERDAVVAALRSLRDPRALEAWVALLGDLRLAPVAARSLGELRDARAVPALESALATQVYPLSIRAIVGALVDLGAPRAALHATAVLAGTEPLPEAWSLLRALGEPGIRVPGTTQPVLASPRGVRIRLAGLSGSSRYLRLYLRTRSDAATTLRIDPLGVEQAVAEGTHETSVELSRSVYGRTLRLRARGRVEVSLALALAPTRR